MRPFVAVVLGAALVLKASGSVSEQYCLLDYAEVFANNDTNQPVTIVHSGTTVVTTLALRTGCESSPRESRATTACEHPILTQPSSGSLRPLSSPPAADGSPANSVTRSQVLVQTSAANSVLLESSTTASQPSGLAQSSAGNSISPSSSPITDRSLAASAIASRTPIPAQPSAGDSVSLSSPTILGEGPVATSPTGSQPPVIAQPSAGNSLPPAMDSPVSGVSLQGQTSIPSIGSTLVSTSLKSSLGSASNTFQGADPASPTTLNAVSGTSAITPSHLMISDSVASSVPSGSVSSTRPASGGGAATQNSTIVLSPLAIDALRLAQFMKNLAVSLANASFTLEQSMDVKAPSSRTDASSSSWSEILRQEREQQQILLRLLGKAGGASVPACEYDLPRNVSSASVLMGTLKSVEAGVFMSLSESISDEDSSATSLLSSMAGAASRQSALLRMHASCNMSSASFETPLSPTWAYNLALNYVRPGSCSVELPVPILPALTVYGGTSAFVRAGMNLTFTWDAAGEAAASRSGKPLHIGWINQVNEPVYTSVLALGDNRGTAQMPPEFAGLAVAVLTAQPGLTSTGDLTDATLAGPVIVHVCR